MADYKPRVLILGGCGFVGRNLVSHLISNDLVGFIRIVDKVPPQIAWLSPRDQECFTNEKVEFKSANLINPDSCSKAFAQDGEPWDFVVNCAGETKIGQTDPVYQDGIYRLSINCATTAASCNVKHYVEVSSGHMLSCDKMPMKEDAIVEPWTFVAKWKHQVELELANIPKLKYTILRPAITYGPGDRHGLITRILVAAIYRYLSKTMNLLWTSNLKLNTIHVEDLCRAIWFVCNRDDTIGQIYNVVDDAESTQGSISDILGKLFNIKIEFYGNLVSGVLDLADAADEANDNHMGPWAEACQKDSIHNTPLSPHMDYELLLHKHLRLDGAKLKSMGFEISYPKPTKEILTDILNEFAKMKIFPRSLLP